MSENVHRTIHEATELHEKSAKGQRFTSVAIAIIAVLAALGTLFAHHRSILALSVKNEAILTQSQASDKYTKSEAKLVRSQVAQALLYAEVPRTDSARKLLQQIVQTEKQSSDDFGRRAKELEVRSGEFDKQSENILTSYETLEIATTFFEVAIVLVSISTLVRTGAFLTVGCTLSGVGIVLLIFGYFQAH